MCFPVKLQVVSRCLPWCSMLNASSQPLYFLGVKQFVFKQSDMANTPKTEACSFLLVLFSPT